MGSGTSNNHKKIEEDLAKTFVNLFLYLNTNDISSINKIVTVSDFLNLCPDNTSEAYRLYLGFRNKLYNFYCNSSGKVLQKSDYENINIDYGSQIGIKTINIIFIIRNLMLEQKNIISDKINRIDFINQQNFLELNNLLEIENFKLNNAQLIDIPIICENISNLRNNLLFSNFKNNILCEGIQDKKSLKIQLVNISLFLIYTNHFFPQAILVE